MNIFLLQETVDELEWSAQDERTIHLKKVLRAKDGEKVDFGVINGPRGKGLLEWRSRGAVKISFDWDAPHVSDLLPLCLFVGLSRPQTCRKIIEQAASLGVAEIIFFQADKGEPSYGESSLWHKEWRHLLIKGAQQAFSCHLPRCLKVDGFEQARAVSRVNPKFSLALDIYEADACISTIKQRKDEPIHLAIGPERGWSAKERECMRGYGFMLCHMGPRVLRVETALVAAVGAISSAYWSGKGWAMR